MLRRAGSRRHLPWPTAELKGQENAPEKASSTLREKQLEENLSHRSAVWKPEDKVLFFFEEFLLPLEPIPTREVTGGHTGSCSHRDFSPPLVFHCAPNKRKRCCFAAPGRTGEGFSDSLKRLFPPVFFNIEFIFTFWMSKTHPVALSIPTSSNSFSKGFRRTEKAKTAPTASSSKTVYFLSAMSNAVYRYHGKKMQNLNKQSSNCPLSVFNYSNASGNGSS